MKRTKVLLLITILISIGIHSCTPKLDCDKFKNGSFYIPLENSNISYQIERRGQYQVEIISDTSKPNDPRYNKTVYEKIEWIDDCSFRITYDESKGELLAYQKEANLNQGVLTEILLIDGDCAYIIASTFVHGEVKTVEGRMCIEK